MTRGWGTFYTLRSSDACMTTCLGDAFRFKGEASRGTGTIEGFHDVPERFLVDSDAPGCNKHDERPYRRYGWRAARVNLCLAPQITFSVCPRRDLAQRAPFSAAGETIQARGRGWRGFRPRRLRGALRGGKAALSSPASRSVDAFIHGECEPWRRACVCSGSTEAARIWHASRARCVDRLPPVAC